MRLFVIMAALAASATALPAAAQSVTAPGFTASVGYTRFADGSEDWDGHAATVRVAGRLHRYFGVEAEGNLGLGSSDIQGVDLKMNHTVAAYAVAYWPLSENFDLTARLGYGSTEFEAEFGGTTVTESYSGVALGLGGQYFFDASNGVRMDVTRHEYDELDGGFDAVSFAYVRRF
jgi:outer membrane immunogenic protein